MFARPVRLSVIAAVPIALALAGVGATLSACDSARPVAHSEPRPSGMIAGAYDPPQSAPEFSLLSSDGSDVTLARYRGKGVLLVFGFTYCAAVCPTTLATLAQALDGLGPDAGSVQVIFVTVDPERDSAAHMRDYLAAFGPAFIGATGAPDALAAVRERYGVTAVRQGAGPDYAMAHTSSIFLIDREGKLRAMMPYGHEPGDFVHDIRLLLAE